MNHAFETVESALAISSIRRRLKRASRSFSRFAALGLLSWVAMTGTTQAAVMTSAGNITGISGSGAYDDAVTFSARYGAGQTDGVIHIVLDLGKVEHIDYLEFINRATVSTNFAISRLEIFVAADENGVNFDPLSPDSFTESVFAEQQLTPHTVSLGAVRRADITDVNKRYLLINFTQSFHTGSNSFSSSANMDRVQFSDIRVVTAIPEPGSVVLLGMAAAGAFLIGTRRGSRS